MSSRLASDSLSVMFSLRSYTWFYASLASIPPAGFCSVSFIFSGAAGSLTVKGIGELGGGCIFSCIKIYNVSMTLWSLFTSISLLRKKSESAWSCKIRRPNSLIHVIFCAASESSMMYKKLVSSSWLLMADRFAISDGESTTKLAAFTLAIRKTIDSFSSSY